MKILVLNPHIDAGHKLLADFRARGVMVLLASDAGDALKQLQADSASIELALVHREAKDGQGEPGLELLMKLKKHKDLMDLPVILSSQQWRDPDFAKHQKSPAGANAYIKFPFSLDQLNPLVHGVLGTGIPTGLSSDDFTQNGSLILESATKVFMGVEKKGAGTIHLELPDADSEMPLPPVEEMAPQSALPEIAPPALASPAVPETAPVSAAEGLETRPQIVDQSSNAPSDGIALVEAPAESVLELSLTPEKETQSVSAALPTPPVSAAADPAPLAPPAVFSTGAEPSLSLSIADLSAPEAPPSIPTAGGGIDLSAFSIPESDLAAAASLAEESPSATMQLPPVPSLAPSGEDAQAATEMPYLFSKPAATPAAPATPAISFAQPQGDAIIPGGAANSPDIETMKKYLLLREQDVAALSVQLESAKDQVRSLEEQLRIERGMGSELTHVVQEQEKRIHELENQQAVAGESVQAELNELKFQVKAKTDKARLMEMQVREAQNEIERLKDRVRQDIRKIRVREKELENRLEIMKKDSEALIGARENKIIELKRKLDLLEFNMDLLQDQYNREKENSAKLRERLAKAAQVVRVVGGLLDSKTAAQLDELAGDEEAA